jgi:hypothetical protein
MRVRVLVSCGLLLAAAVGCSKNEPAAQGAAAPPAAATSAPAAATPAARPPPPAAAPAAIATTEGSFDRVRVDVTELKRTGGGTVTLKFMIVNDSGRDLGQGDVVIGTGGLMEDGYSIAGVHLIDPVGKKKYFVAKDSAGKCVCSSFGIVPGGGRANHWAKFPAPPDEVDRISIMIPPFAPMDDVPLSR